MGVRDWREVGELTVGSERYSHRCRRFLRKESGAPTIEGTAEPGFEYRKEAGFYRMEDSDNALVLLDAIWIKGSA